MAPEEGTSANPGDVLGLNASMLENLVVENKLLEIVIPQFDREEVGKLDVDWAISRLFHGIGQGTILLQVKIVFRHFLSFDKFTFLPMVVLASFLIGHVKELKDEAMTQQA